MTNHVAAALAIKRCPHVFSADVSISLTGSRPFFFPKRKKERMKESKGGEGHLTGTRAQRTSQVRRFVSMTITICHWAVSVKYGSICSHAATRRISSLTLSLNLLRITNTPSYPLFRCARKDMKGLHWPPHRPLPQKSSVPTAPVAAFAYMQSITAVHPNGISENK